MAMREDRVRDAFARQSYCDPEEESFGADNSFRSRIVNLAVGALMVFGGIVQFFYPTL